MKDFPLRTTVIGSYPFPGWLEFACQNLDKFGEADREELIDDAVTIAILDQLEAGLDVITDGEQTRLDFNLSFYGFLEGIEIESAPPRRFGPPAHDQRGRHKVVGELRAPRGLGAVRDFERLKRLAAPILSANNRQPPVLRSPSAEAELRGGGQCCGGWLNHAEGQRAGPYTLSGRLIPNQRYQDRYGFTETLLPIVRDELMALVKAGCREICVDEPSMSCYAHAKIRRSSSIFSIARWTRSTVDAASRRIFVLEISKVAPSVRAATRRCFRRSTICWWTKFTLRWRAANSPSWKSSVKLRRRRTWLWHYRREELLH